MFQYLPLKDEERCTVACNLPELTEQLRTKYSPKLIAFCPLNVTEGWLTSNSAKSKDRLFADTLAFSSAETLVNQGANQEI